MEVNGYKIEPFASLQGAKLRRANLRKANLFRADLSEAELSLAKVNEGSSSFDIPSREGDVPLFVIHGERLVGRA